jgi:hypothetical protein
MEEDPSSIKGRQMSARIIERLRLWKHDPILFVKDCIQVTPSSQQLDGLAKIKSSERTTIRSGHGCHARGTAIHMFPYGFECVEDIEVGDLLMGDDNTPREVLELYRGRETMYRIKYSDGTYYDVNESHKLALVCTGSKGRYVTGQKIEISVRDFLQFSPTMQGRFGGYKVAVEYPEIPVLIPPYILGLWLGDGSHNALELTSVDGRIILIWKKFGEMNGLTLTSCGEKLHRLVGDKDRAVWNAFKHYDLVGNKHIPKEYLFNSKEARLQLLAGLIDTDGYADVRKNSLQFQIIQKRKDLAEDILFLAQSCGMHATMSEKIKSWTYEGEKNSGVYWEVRISRNTEIIPTQIQRKKFDGIVTKQRSNLHFGFTVEKLEEDEYYGFEVDGNHLYVLGDFTVTRNTGKDAFAAWVILWFMTTRPYAKVVCTAPTNRQLADILWSELSKWLRKSALTDEFILQKDKMFHFSAPKEWWCRAVSPSVKASKEDQAETLAGFHGDHLLIVVDEASGVPDPVFIPLEGAMTQEDNIALMIGNMTQGSGYFYDSHFHPILSKSWERLHWDSRNSSNVKAGFVNYMAQKYGENSNVFAVRVKGDPPVEDETVVIPLSWGIQCVGNEVTVAEDEPKYGGVDVARFGDDVSILMPRQGLKIFPWETFRGMNTIDLAGFVGRFLEEENLEGVGIDEIGIGAGVVDWLMKHVKDARRVFGVNVSSKAIHPEQFSRLRDELWWRMREKCMKKLYSFPDLTVEIGGTTLNLGHELANELSGPHYEFEGGKIKVESKKRMKLRGIPSPNIADALGLTEYFHTTAHLIWKKEEAKKKKSRTLPGGQRVAKGRNRWMYA